MNNYRGNLNPQKYHSVGEHVTSIEQSKKLWDLGFRKESIFAWVSSIEGYGTEMHEVVWNTPDMVEFTGKGYEFVCQAYLLSEIMEALPNKIKCENKLTYYPYLSKGEYEKYEAEYRNLYYDDIAMQKQDKSPVTAACDLLIWCIENGFISTK